MKGKLASVIAALSLLAPGEASLALEYQFPPDPVAPTSASECNAIYDQYAAIAEQVRARAKAAGDMAWQIVVQTGPYDPEAKSLYARSQMLFDEASRVLSEASAARLRCMKRVYAHQADQADDRRKADEQRLNSYGSPGKYAADLSGPVAKAAALNGFKTLDELGKAPPDLAIFGKLHKIGETVSDLSGRGGAGGYVSQLVNGLDYLGEWGPLRAFMVKNSLRELLAINSAATSAWQSELSAFDNSGLGGLVSGTRQADSSLFSGNATVPDLSGPPDTLAEDELEAYREHQGMYAGRGKAYDQALAEVQREYRSVMSRPAAQTGGGGPAAFRYSAAQCRAIQAQIQEYYRVLPQYSAAGQGGLIQRGINSNQREYDRGCR